MGNKMYNKDNVDIEDDEIDIEELYEENSKEGKQIEINAFKKNDEEYTDDYRYEIDDDDFTSPLDFHTEGRW